MIIIFANIFVQDELKCCKNCQRMLLLPCGLLHAEKKPKRSSSHAEQVHWKFLVSYLLPSLKVYHIFLFWMTIIVIHILFLHSLPFRLHKSTLWSTKRFIYLSLSSCEAFKSKRAMFMYILLKTFLAKTYKRLLKEFLDCLVSCYCTLSSKMFIPPTHTYPLP